MTDVTPTSKPPTRTSKLAIASFSCIVLGFVVVGLMTLTSTGILPLRYLVAVILGVSAIVLGHLARRQIRRAGGAFTGRGLSFLALCFGYAILSGIIGIGVLLFLFFHDVSRTFDDGSIADTSLQNSQELILGTRAIDLIESADVVEYPKEEHRTFEYSFLDWQTAYPGFRRIHLGREQARQLIMQMQSGESKLVPRVLSNIPETQLSEIREFQTRRYHAAFPEGEQAEPVMGAVVVHLRGPLFGLFPRKAAWFAFQVGPRDGAMLYSSDDMNRGWKFFDGSSEVEEFHAFSTTAGTTLKNYLAQASVGNIEAMYPELSTPQVNEKARSKFGYHYCDALRFLGAQPQLADELGPLLEARPARAVSSWMSFSDFTATYYFKVRGEKDQAVVILNFAGSLNWAKLCYKSQMMDLEPGDFEWTSSDRIRELENTPCPENGMYSE